MDCVTARCGTQVQPTKMTLARQRVLSNSEVRASDLESHLGLRRFLSPLMVDSLHLPLFSYVDLLNLKQFHFSFIYPYLTYGITRWGSVCKTRLRKIKTKQNKCVRYLFFAYGRDNAMPYFNLLEILTIENIYKFKVSLFTHKITNNATTSLTLASEVHGYNTRSASILKFHQQWIICLSNLISLPSLSIIISIAFYIKL